MDISAPFYWAWAVAAIAGLVALLFGAAELLRWVLLTFNSIPQMAAVTLASVLALAGLWLALTTRPTPRKRKELR